MPGRFHHLLCEWRRRSAQGVAAIEFALCAPLLLLLLLGSMEVSLLLMSDRKVTSSTSAMVDLATRFEEMDRDDLDNIFVAGDIIMSASPSNNARARLTSIRIENGQTVVDWSVGCGPLQPYSPDDPISIPQDLISGSDTILLAETEYGFNSLFGFVIQGQRTLSDSFYQRPRTADRIKLKFPPSSYSCPW